MEEIFCALDLETTGVNPFFDKIIEIGIVKFNSKGIIDTFSSFINPEVPIPKNSFYVHGISDDMVEDAPTITEIILSIDNFIDTSLLVIQNPLFDLSFLKNVYQENNMNFSKLQAFDTVRLSKMAFPDFPNHKLSTLCRMLNIEINAHRAFSDANGCMEVFKKSLAILGNSDNLIFSQIIQIHGNLIKPGFKKSNLAKIPGKIKIGKKIKIQYCDLNENITERFIKPQEIMRYGKENYVRAFCYLRNSERFFVISRIKKIL